MNSKNAFTRLYEDSKYKKSYLLALKLLYQLKEKENCPFHPKINKVNFDFCNNSLFLLNNKIEKLKRYKRNCLSNINENSNNSININNLYNKKRNKRNTNFNFSKLYNKKKYNEKSIFNSANSSFYNTLTKSQVSPLSNSNNYYNQNDKMNLEQKLTFDYNYIKNEDNIKTKIEKNLLNNLTNPNESFNKKFNDKNIELNSKISSLRNSNNCIIYDEKDKKEKNEKYSLTYEQLNIKGNNILKKNDNINLQSIPDEALFFYAETFLANDNSLKKFRLNQKKKIKKNI